MASCAGELRRRVASASFVGEFCRRVVTQVASASCSENSLHCQPRGFGRAPAREAPRILYLQLFIQ